PHLPRQPLHPVRHHHHVCRPRHGRHRHLGKPGSQRGTTPLGPPEPCSVRQQGERQVSIVTGSALTDLITEASALTEDEVITKALSRDITLPGGAGTCVLITLDNGLDHKRPNTFGPGSLGELNTAIDAALARDDIAGIAVTGKPWILAAGADLSQVAKITSIDHARAIAQIGHGVFDKLRTAKVPTFAFINGLALG